MDELYKLLADASDKRIERWIKLLRTSRKVCVGFWAGTQHPGLQDFGDSDVIRSLLGQYTVLALRTKGQVSRTILEVDVDLSQLPTLPGYGYVIGGDSESVRTAPFRADYLSNDAAEELITRIQRCPLDAATAEAAGPAYLNRHELAAKAKEERKARRQAEAARRAAGLPREPLPQQRQAESARESVELRPVRRAPLSAASLPRLTVIEGGGQAEQAEPVSAVMVAERQEQPKANARTAVLAAFRSGLNSPAELADRTGYSRPSVMRALSDLTSGKSPQVVQGARGQYRLSDDAE